MSKNYTKTFQNASDKFFTNGVENLSEKTNIFHSEKKINPNLTYNTHSTANTNNTYNKQNKDTTLKASDTYDVYDTGNTHDLDNVCDTLDTANYSDAKKYHRLTLMIDLFLATYLKDESWKNKTSVTQYLMGLILEDQKNTNKKFIETLKYKYSEKRKRLDLKIQPELILYLKEEAWENKTSVNQYLNNLVQQDFEKNTI